MSRVFDIIWSIMITFKQQNAIECHGFFSLAIIGAVVVIGLFTFFVCDFFSLSLFIHLAPNFRHCAMPVSKQKERKKNNSKHMQHIDLHTLLFGYIKMLIVPFVLLFLSFSFIITIFYGRSFPYIERQKRSFVERDFSATNQILTITEKNVKVVRQFVCADFFSLSLPFFHSLSLNSFTFF